MRHASLWTLAGAQEHLTRRLQRKSVLKRRTSSSSSSLCDEIILDMGIGQLIGSGRGNKYSSFFSLIIIMYCKGKGIRSRTFQTGWFHGGRSRRADWPSEYLSSSKCDVGKLIPVSVSDTSWQKGNIKETQEAISFLLLLSLVDSCELL